MRYFLGVDVGGTKSSALIADENGRALGMGETGAGNHEMVGYEGLKEALHRAVGGALAQAAIDGSQLSGAGFGIAGYDWPSELQPTMQAINTLHLGVEPLVVNDAVLGLVAGTEEGWGIVVVAGTGSNCRGRTPDGREGRVTGCGRKLGEYGGGGDLVAEAVRAVARQWTMRGPDTALTDRFIAHTGARNVEDLLEGLTLGRLQLDALAAPLVFAAAIEGDAVARSLVNWAGRELGSLATGVVRQLHLERITFDAILAGGLFDGGEMLLRPLREAIVEVAPGARFRRLSSPPVAGGVLLAMESAGLSIARLRPALLASIEERFPLQLETTNSGYGPPLQPE